MVGEGRPARRVRRRDHHLGTEVRKRLGWRPIRSFRRGRRDCQGRDLERRQRDESVESLLALRRVETRPGEDRARGGGECVTESRRTSRGRKIWIDGSRGAAGAREVNYFVARSFTSTVT